MYEKQTWQTGDVVTSAKLNHMEDGIAAGGAFVVHATWDEAETTCTLDKTWSEINTAAQTMPVYIVEVSNAGAEDETQVYIFCGCYIDQHISGNVFNVGTACIGSEGTVVGYVFVADSVDGYPAYTDESGD